VNGHFQRKRRRAIVEASLKTVKERNDWLAIRRKVDTTGRLYLKLWRVPDELLCEVTVAMYPATCWQFESCD